MPDDPTGNSRRKGMKNLGAQPSYKVRLRRAGAPAHSIADTLLGQNLEAYTFAMSAMMADRLANPKFAGPADPQTGIAVGWRPTDGTMGDLRCQLTPGMSLSGNESQLIQRYGVLDEGILQTGRSVRRGETLEVELWAKVRHRPVTVQFEIGPLPIRQPPYDSAKVTVDAAYWKRYAVRLNIPRDDNEAVFKCLLLEEGTLCIDQVHLRPAGEPDLRRDLIERIGTLRIPALRFPGGCISTNYHWRHGLGPAHLRPVLPDPVFKMSTCYEFGTEEYLELCLSQGIRPHITVNVGSGTPDEAADWAAYCADWYRQRGERPPPAYFQIGNEHYGVHESAHMTGEMYVAALKEFVPPIRNAYPGCRIIALGQIRSAGLRPEWRTPWLVPVLEQAAEHFDILSLNRYKGQWNETPMDLQVNAVESVPKMENDLRELIGELRSRGLKQKVALTEWNYWLYASHWDSLEFCEPGDAQHGFFVAGMLNMFARLGADLEVGSYYHLVQGMAIFVRRGADVMETCIADVFRMYRPAFPGTFLPLDVASPKLGGTEAALDALALKTRAATWLFLANRSPTESMQVALDGFPPRASEVSMLCAASPREPLRRAEPGSVGKTIKMPPLSLCRVKY
jgi:alpha-N-arabinofuranosidase